LTPAAAGPARASSGTSASSAQALKFVIRQGKLSR
jgi:hypothetical protein